MTEFTQSSLAALDKLWAVPSLTLSDVSRCLAKEFGVRFTDEEIVKAARRNNAPVVAKAAVKWMRVRQPVVRVDNSRVRLVAPGTRSWPVRRKQPRILPRRWRRNILAWL